MSLITCLYPLLLYVTRKKKCSPHLFTRLQCNWKKITALLTRVISNPFPCLSDSHLTQILSQFCDVSTFPLCQQMISDLQHPLPSLHILYKNTIPIRTTYLIFQPDSPPTYLYLYTHIGLPCSYSKKVTAPILAQPLQLLFLFFSKKKKNLCCPFFFPYSINFYWIFPIQLKHTLR